MTAAVEAIYEDGLLRPLQPLALPEHARVRISVETMDERIVCLSLVPVKLNTHANTYSSHSQEWRLTPR